MAMTEAEYIEGRRLSTVADIAEANGSLVALEVMLANRKTLARIYAEDGAIRTARCIETLDVPLIKAAIAKFE